MPSSITLTNRHVNFNTAGEREHLAKYLSCMVEGFSHSEKGTPIPYMPTEGDTSYWTIDAGNDIKVQFFDGEPNRFDLVHRYSVDNIEALARWIERRTTYVINRSSEVSQQNFNIVVQLTQVGNVEGARKVATYLFHKDAVVDVIESAQENVRTMPFHEQTH